MNKNKYEEEYLPHNYSIHIADIADSLFGKKWNKLGRELSGKQLGAVLYMYGLDVKRQNDVEPLSHDTLMRSPITGHNASGGFLYVGYERTDETWKKNGIKNLQKYMYTEDGVNEFIKVLGVEIETTN